MKAETTAAQLPGNFEGKADMTDGPADAPPSFQAPPWTQGPGMWNVGPVNQPFTAPQMFGMEMYPH